MKPVADSVKTEVLGALKAAGATFVDTYLSVAEGPQAGQVTVNGPITLKGNQKAASVTLAKGKDGKWAIMSVK